MAPNSDKSPRNSNVFPSESRGEYGNVPLTDQEDVLEAKKALSTAPPDGWRNHPGSLLCFVAALETRVTADIVFRHIS